MWLTTGRCRFREEDSDFVVQLDAHGVGAVIFLGIVVIAAVALALAHRLCTASGQRVDKGG